MGRHYTLLSLNASLDHTHPRFRDFQSIMAKDFTILSSHELFKTKGWTDIFFPNRMDAFPGDSFFRVNEFCELSIYVSVVNYNNLVEIFLDWLQPMVISQGFLGYYVFEEEKDTPSLIFSQGGSVEY